MRSRGIGNSGLGLPGPMMMPPAPSSPAQRTNRTSERELAHFFRSGRDVHIDVRHIDGDQPQPPFAKIAKRAQRCGIEVRRPEVAGKEHQLDPAIALVGEPGDGVGGAAIEDVGIGVDGKACGHFFHACSLCCVLAAEPASAKWRPAI
jgi:hypothetical protein